jgi:hypothetical protein
MKYPTGFDYRGACIELAKVAGVQATAVYNWKRKGSIPRKYARLIKAYIEKLDAPVVEPAPETLDLFDDFVRPQVTLADIAQTIADYLRQKGL